MYQVEGGQRDGGEVSRGWLVRDLRRLKAAIRASSLRELGGVAWGGEPSCHGSSNQGMSQLLLQSFLQEKICARAPFLYMYVYL